MATESTALNGAYSIADSEKPYLQINFGRDDTGAVDVELITPPISKEEPIRVTLNGATVAERNIPALRRCDCPDSAEALVDRVHVQHTEICISGEPRRYVWQSEGWPYTGTLADYARQWEQGIYSGDRGSADAHALYAWTDDRLDRYPVTVSSFGPDEDDWLKYRLSVGDEWVLVRIDGRV